jgi:hypothetical protein
MVEEFFVSLILAVYTLDRNSPYNLPHNFAKNAQITPQKAFIIVLAGLEPLHIVGFY